MTNIKWVTLFSQSGREVAEVAKQLGRTPDLIITNQRPGSIRTISQEVLNLGQPIVTLSNKPTVKDYQEILSSLGTVSGNIVITLHGWLRIIPQEIIQEYPYMFNGHPGLITKYPELKGKDPQLKAWDLGLETSGCVIHRVIPEVDSGSILREQEIPIRNLNLPELFANLHKTSIDLWGKFLKRHWF